MNSSTKVQANHRERQAVVYLRQSSPKQVLENRESAVNQRALRERLLELGWSKGQIVLIDEDQGQSAKHAAGREGFQRLVAEVGLRKIGIVMGYEVSRLSRNCADWHQLLELCAVFDTLIADADGIYSPRDFNDRLLLGLKGTMSEAELHSLRLRLDAGRLSKARRGELVHHVPTGYIREPDGIVRFDHDQSIQDRIRLVFTKFRELGGAQKVLRHLARHGLKLPRRQTSGLHAGQILWKDPGISAVYAILKNPAYAGAFAYGRRVADPSRMAPGRRATGRVRQPRERWLALVKDVYPAYITWAEYEQIQERIAENRQKMAERLTRKQATRKGTALLPGLIRCGHCGHAMQVAYRGRRFRYICQAVQSRYAKPACQSLSGHAIDEVVTQEFFHVLHPAQIDALERVSARQTQHHHELVRHLEQEVQRLDYAAKRAERQYDAVDPENRLIAATLERKWEEALAALEQARSRFDEARGLAPQPVAIPQELRTAFADVGKGLPEIWATLSAPARKELLRTLVVGVHLRRDDEGIAHIRIVWRGGLATEKSVRVPMSSFRYSEREKRVLGRIRELADAGHNDSVIAEHLNREDFFPCRGGVFTPQIVLKLRCRNCIWLGLGKLRRGHLPPGCTIREMAKKIDIDPSWIYRAIGKGHIKVPKNSVYGCYLFPSTRAAVQRLKELKNGKVSQVSFPEVHCDG